MPTVRQRLLPHQSAPHSRAMWPLNLLRVSLPAAPLSVHHLPRGPKILQVFTEQLPQQFPYQLRASQYNKHLAG